MRRIVVLLIDNINYDSRVQKEIDTLYLLGFKVTLIVWNNKPIIYRREKLDIINIELGSYNHRYGKLFTFLSRIRFWYLASKIIRKGNYDYIHCNDLDTLGILFFLPKEYWKCVVYDAHELYPEEYPVNSIQYFIWTIIERQLSRRVKTIITPEINRSIFLKKKYKLKRIPFVINNYPQFQIIRPKNIKSEFNIGENSILLVYAGVIGPGRGISAIIKALNYLPNYIFFILIGYSYSSNYIANLRRLIDKCHLSNRVFFYGSVSPRELLQTIAGCDIGISLYENISINNYYCAPNKVFDYLMSGIKVISNAYPPLEILKKYSFVRLVPKINSKSITKCVLDLACDNSEILESVKRKYSWESFYNIFNKIYK